MTDQPENPDDTDPIAKVLSSHLPKADKLRIIALLLQELHHAKPALAALADRTIDEQAKLLVAEAEAHLRDN